MSVPMKSVLATQGSVSLCPLRQRHALRRHFAQRPRQLNCTTPTTGQTERRRYAGDRLRATEESTAPSTEDAAELAEQPDPPNPQLEKAKTSFKTCGVAIRAGVDLFQQERYIEALDVFTNALELPGEGRFRIAGRAKEFSGPSQSEEHAILYNMTCCYSQLQELDSGFTVLQELLESDFEDFSTLRSDSDLAELRRDPRFEQILSQRDSLQGKVMKMFRKKPTVNKPWLI